MNLPNILTMCRVLLTLFFIFFLGQPGTMPKILALMVFTLASVTDFLDGYYARTRCLITAFGKIMDPIADKFLILSAFFIFTQMRIVAFWIFAIIFVREVLVTALRLIAIGKGRALAAEGAGKLKTVLQIAAVYLIMIFIILASPDTSAEWHRTLMPVLAQGIYLFMMAVMAVTLWSGLSFVWNNRQEIFHAG
ncbi:MAG TPA: CDP-diacylglycerol--glycerol-3-phosphate 3-phosphatidyltransferase [Candidatus Omnitrophota bacterium]|nr:CDP-diacylglycerol--glycerol-3-phosphate 3-phosphatidyltransferase [Candidatus Omnitrophota bacterium]